ncbi:hypothetical protein [Actinomadura sp. CNU-125]|uniref:hypothetical protein n=1 Tax=Actinomadura sp. CNU-125 TaxID=1904961 RepID=UPI001177FD39|nr:hypothetical protein [Actinomadura sp. CNU-125]
MPDRIDATLLALDAYQQQLLPGLAIGHRESRAEAEGLIHGLVDDLFRYADHNDLDTVDFLDRLVRARLDRDSYPMAAPDRFRLNAEVEFRPGRPADDVPNHRGFINELKASPTGQDVCAVRVPGLAEPLRARTSDLRPAVPIPLIPTRTTGIVHSATEVEATVIAMSIEMLRDPTGAADPPVLADFAELSGTLANWSGTTPAAVVQHLRHIAWKTLHAADDDTSAPSPADVAATAFPDDLTAVLRGDDPAPSTRPQPPPSSSRPSKHRP